MTPLYTYKSAIRLFFKPESEWQNIFQNSKISTLNLFLILVLPLTILLSVCNIIGFYLFDPEPSKHSSMYLFSACATLLFSFLCIYLSSLLVKSFAVYPTQKERFNKAFVLIAFSYTPGLIFNSLAFLFPVVHYLSILSLYSFYILYKGVTPILNVPERRKTGYFTFILIGLLSVYAFLGACFIGLANSFGF